MLIADTSAECYGAEGGALAATCLGFGCNPYGDIGFNGLSKEAAPPGSMPYSEFLAALKAKKVERVIFEPPAGDEAYAVIDGNKIRVGEGWPIEMPNSWSSPSWVVRILENEKVPYTWNFDLRAGIAAKPSPSVPRSRGRDMSYESVKVAINSNQVEGVVFNPGAETAFAVIGDETAKFDVDRAWKRNELERLLTRRGIPNNMDDAVGAKQQYRPSPNRASALDSSTPTGESFTAQPKMYGGAEMAQDTTAVDWAGNFK